MKKYFVLLAVLVLVLSCFFGKTLVMASDEESSAEYARYYREIEIESGDTLWSIAQTYHQNSGMDIREYIQEVKQMNQMVTNEIHAGDSLTIVYFSETPLTK